MLTVWDVIDLLAAGADQPLISLPRAADGVVRVAFDKEAAQLAVGLTGTLVEVWDLSAPI